MDKLIGKMLDGRYEILEVIGIGGMAIVYKAKCHRLNRFVAVKIMKDEYAGDEEFRRRFFDESQAVAMLSHPNIVNVYDVSRSDGIEYIVMELIDGITLKEYLHKKKQLSWKETTFFGIQIAKALEHAHSRDIIHRDIKPQNIMLLRDGTIKVADFGIAHNTASQRTYGKGEAIGSVHYVSPEQARGSHIDNRSDIYSFGVVLYEMLTGRLPFEGNTPIEVAIQHKKSLPLPPSDYVEDIPQALEAIIQKAMNPSPSKRYSSATEMLADFELFKNDPSITIEVEAAAILSAEDVGDIDSTRKIANTGQLSREAQPAKGTEYVHIDDEPYRSPGSSLKVAFISVIIFLLSAVFFVLKVINPFSSDGEEKIKIPTFTGVEYVVIQEDKDRLYGDVIVIVENELFDDNVPKGTVISQKPDAGRSAVKGTEVRLVVSLGPKTVTLENYAGMEERSVGIMLDRLGLKPTFQYEFSDDVEKGLVIAQSPTADTVLNSGDSILLRISKGPENPMCTVPQIIGLTEEKARKAIIDAGLLPGTVIHVESKEPVGLVTFQSLPSGSSVPKDTTVDFNLSKKASSGTTDDNKRKTVNYTITLDNIQGQIQVIVAVDSVALYSQYHYYSDGKTITIELTAEAGLHTVSVFQNGRLTKEEAVNFQ